MGPRSRRLRVCWPAGRVVSDRQSGPVQLFGRKLWCDHGLNQLQRYIVGHATIWLHILSVGQSPLSLCLPRRSPETAGRRRSSHFSLLLYLRLEAEAQSKRSNCFVRRSQIPKCGGNPRLADRRG